NFQKSFEIMLISSNKKKVIKKSISYLKTTRLVDIFFKIKKKLCLNVDFSLRKSIIIIRYVLGVQFSLQLTVHLIFSNIFCQLKIFYLFIFYHNNFDNNILNNNKFIHLSKTKKYIHDLTVVVVVASTDLLLMLVTFNSP
ncbi:hypothetical protein RFI_00416, partial [Reticulomyxa filosa]